jgi:hypothetical protein
MATTPAKVQRSNAEILKKKERKKKETGHERGNSVSAEHLTLAVENISNKQMYNVGQGVVKITRTGIADLGELGLHLLQEVPGEVQAGISTVRGLGLEAHGRAVGATLASALVVGAGSVPRKTDEQGG